MQFVPTVGWVACVLYSTVPSFWLMVHPRAHRWRARVRSPFRVLLPAWITMWIGVGALTGPWRKLALYSTPWTWIPAGLLFATGIFLYLRSGAHFSLAQLEGVPELRSNQEHHRLVTSGIRARVRHPVYLAHLCEMLAWSLGTGLLVCWLLTAFAIVTGAVMIRMEDMELEKRFGDEFRKYRNTVPAVLPRATTSQDERPQFSSDGVVIRYEFQGREVWRIAIAELVCIGEYTNTSGPLDDYFLVFGVRSDLWYEASLYSDGRDETIEAIGKALSCELHLGLIQSTTLASRILWPQELEGQPLLVDKSLNPEVKRFKEARQL